MLHIIFAVGSSKNLGVSTCREGGERAGSSYELDAAQSIQSKLLYHILYLLGGFFKGTQA
jgi:hypothetical protein